MVTEKETTVLEKATQDQLTPIAAKVLLQEGNERFVSEKMKQRGLMAQVEKTSSGQFPHSIVLSCIDSRIPTEIVFDQGVGDIFNARVAGNIVNEDILGSMEFACAVSGSKLIVVLGHTACGAVKGACDNVELGNLTPLLHKIQPAVEAVKTEEGTDRSSKNLHFVDQVSHVNVEMTIENIKKQSPTLNGLVEKGEVEIVGAMYDVSTGKVEFYS